MASLLYLFLSLSLSIYLSISLSVSLCFSHVSLARSLARTLLLLSLSCSPETPEAAVARPNQPLAGSPSPPTRDH